MPQSIRPMNPGPVISKPRETAAHSGVKPVATRLWFIAALLVPVISAATQVQSTPHPRASRTVITTGQAPHQIAFSPDGNTAYIAAAGSDRIDLVDVQTRSWRSAIPAPGTPLGVAVDARGNILTSRFRGAGLTPLDSHGRPAADIDIGAAPSLFTSIRTEKYPHAWLVSSERANQLSLITSTPWQRQKVFTTGQRPFPADATTNGRAFVPNYDDGTVSVFDLHQGESLATIAVGDRPSGGAVLPGEQLYAVTVRGEDRIALIDTQHLHVSGEIRAGIGTSPFSVVADAQLQLAFVNNTASHDISVIDLNRMQVIQRLQVGEIPIVMAVQPDHQALWVACEGTHDLHIVDLSFAHVTTDPSSTGAPDANPTMVTSPAANSPVANQSVTHQTRVIPIMTTDAQPVQSIADAAVREVRELHYFFQEWFSGRLEQTEDHFKRFSDVSSPQLSFVSPAAETLQRQALIEYLWQAHGQDNQATLRIWTENETARPLGPNTWLVVYEEHQIRGQQQSVRLSSVIFQTQEGTPNGLVWQHVHETWLKAPAENS